MTQQPLFLHYDRAALDREYDNRAKVADFAGYLRHYETASRAVRDGGRWRVRLDIAYDQQHAPGQTLDVFRPQGSALPVNVFIHGGYWKSLSKNDFSFVANGLCGAGAVCVVIDYALIPAVDMDTLVSQCRAALAWVWRNAAALGADRDRLYVSGHSAGGHLTAMMLATDWPALAADLPVELIRGACGISGLYDLEPIRLCFLNDELGLEPAAAQRNSPSLLQRHGAAPLLLPLGGLEGPEYLRQSRVLADAWHNTEVRVFEDENHFSIIAELDRQDSRLSEALGEQMRNG